MSGRRWRVQEAAATRRYLVIPLLAVALAGCGSSGNSRASQKQILDLQATVAALAARTPVYVTPTLTPTPEVFALEGSLSSFQPECDRVSEGDNVTVYNESAAVIATATTTHKHVVLDPVFNPINDCVVDFFVQVPRAQFQRVKIAAHDGPTYSFDEMQKRGWILNLSLK